MKLWLANKIIYAMYLLLAWAMEQKVNAEQGETFQLIAFPADQQGNPINRQAMN